MIVSHSSGENQGFPEFYSCFPQYERSGDWRQSCFLDTTDSQALNTGKGDRIMTKGNLSRRAS